ncbi:MAG: hypothetical protein IAI49_02450 [Candidatus Eremiobacteraeota bacterium]|nr:hypothetical protein [Candidatus Eremiobacteraeota bacterium]
MRTRFAFFRSVLGLVAVGELAWSLAFYVRPELALGLLGRGLIDPVICRQYPLYLASVALAYALAATDPQRYRGLIWVCVAQRGVEFVAAVLDSRAGAIATSSFFGLAALESVVGLALAAGLRGGIEANDGAASPDRRDRGLARLLRAFGGLEAFWFLASSIFVQVGSRLLHWKLQDPYTTQQQGIALLIIGLTSLVAASDVSRYRIFVWVPVASQLIGIANAFNEIRLGSIGWATASVQWTIECSIVAAFAYFARGSFARKTAPALAEP